LGPADALWHLLNFFAPAIGMGLLAPLIAKLVWRREFKAARWRRLVLWATVSSALVLVAALVVLRGDGKMLTYGAMVLACAFSLWWVGFGSRR